MVAAALKDMFGVCRALLCICGGQDNPDDQLDMPAVDDLAKAQKGSKMVIKQAWLACCLQSILSLSLKSKFWALALSGTLTEKNKLAMCCVKYRHSMKRVLSRYACSDPTT